MGVSSHFLVFLVICFYLSSHLCAGAITRLEWCNLNLIGFCANCQYKYSHYSLLILVRPTWGGMYGVLVF